MEAPDVPRTPAELVQTVPCPLRRIAAVTAIARRQNWLSPEWAALRIADLAEAIAAGVDGATLIQTTGLTRSRLSQLRTKVMRG